jgi:predicted DNA-binding transcriptional regulator YafY
MQFKNDTVIFAGKPTKVLRFTYKNYKGNISKREVTVMYTFFGTDEWHPEPQWILAGYDSDKEGMRFYAMNNMTDVTSVPEGEERDGNTIS